MRHALHIAFAGVQVLAATSAVALDGEGKTPTSQEILQIWNRQYDPSAGSPVTGLSGADGILDAPAFDTSEQPAPTYAAPGGGSLTPNLDRLLSRHGRTGTPAPGAFAAPGDLPTADGQRSPTGSGMQWRSADTSWNTIDPRGGSPSAGVSSQAAWKRRYPNTECNPPLPPPDDDQGGHQEGHGGGHSGGGNGGGGHGGGGDGGGHTPPTPTPEPGTLLLLGAGASAAAALRVRRRRTENGAISTQE